MKKILVISDAPPDPTINAGDRRLVALMAGLAKVARVAFSHSTPGANQRALAHLEQAGVEVIPWMPRWVEGALAVERWDVCVMEFWHLAERFLPVVRRISPGTAVVVDSVDAHFRRELAAAALGLMPRAGIAERAAREVGVYSSADQVIVVNEADRQALAEAGVRGDIAIVPIIVRIRVRADRAREPCALFVGGFNHAPNEDGLLWFCGEVWPKVRARLPKARLRVVGSNATGPVLALSGLEGVEVVGYVESTEPFLDAAAVSVAPLRYGAGMKGKVCEALASGMPLVTTTVGADGLALRNGRQAIVADDPDGFAAGVVWAIENQAAAHRMGAAGRAIVEDTCSEAAISRTLGALANSQLWRGRWAPIPTARWRAWALPFRILRRVWPPLSWAKRRLLGWLGGRK